MDIIDNYKPNAVAHLFETAHSGFYGEGSSAEVNLVPKTWTKYTITDGDWMTENTLDPLINRDIYLANKIDEVDKHGQTLYKAGPHIIIDEYDNTISFNPLEYNYIFTDGIIKNGYDVSTDLPDNGSVQNRLCLSESGLSYQFTKGTEDIASAMTGHYDKIAGLIGEDEYPEGANIVLVTSATYTLDKSYSDSGEWIEGYTELYDSELEKKVRTEYHGIRPPVLTADIHEHDENIFAPSDNTEFSPDELTGGKNYNNEGVSFNPTGVLYIYD